MIKTKFRLLLFFFLLTLLAIGALAEIESTGPDLIFSDYFGGSADDFAYAIAVDSNGNTWIAGSTSSPDLPAHNTVFNGSVDAFIAIFDPAGNLIHCDYFGGSGGDYANAIAVDPADNIYITGGTTSSDLPFASGDYNGESDGFIAKFDPSGNLIYSTYLGGTGGDNCKGIAVDLNGNVYVTGFTSSSDFPVTPGAHDLYWNGDGDAFMAKFDPSGNLIYSTYLGGSGGDSDWGYGIAVDLNGNVYVTGRTGAVDFPVTPGVYDGSYNGIGDGFVAKFDSIGNLIYSTYLGGVSLDDCYAIAVDEKGCAYVTGTAFDGFPTTPDAYCPDDNGWNDTFIAKLDPTGAYLEYSTFLGGRESDYGFGIKVDSKGYVWVIGHTYSDNLPITAGAFATEYHGEADTFIARLDPTGRHLIYSTYLGGADVDSGQGIDINEADEVIYVHIVGYTESLQFLGSFGAYEVKKNGGADIFVAKILFPSIANLFISTTTGGTTEPNPGTHSYDIGTQVQIEAIPDDGYRFDKWTGDIPAGQEEENPITIIMDLDKSLTPNFIRQYTLTISATIGGTTDPSPGTYTYEEGTEVIVKAIPDSEYEFSSWSGDASGTDNPITIVLDKDKSVTANFKVQISPDEPDKPEGCFIATAAYGSLWHPCVERLRNFRDKHLRTNKFGRWLVKVYYKISPPIANVIRKHKPLKIVVRIMLWPLIVLN